MDLHDFWHKITQHFWTSAHLKWVAEYCLLAIETGIRPHADGHNPVNSESSVLQLIKYDCTARSQIYSKKTIKESVLRLLHTTGTFPRVVKCEGNYQTHIKALWKPERQLVLHIEETPDPLWATAVSVSVPTVEDIAAEAETNASGGEILSDNVAHKKLSMSPVSNPLTYAIRVSLSLDLRLV